MVGIIIYLKSLKCLVINYYTSNLFFVYISDRGYNILKNERSQVMSNEKQIKDEELKRVSGGTIQIRSLECPACGKINDVQYDDGPCAIIRGVCSRCGLDYRGRYFQTS